MWHRVWIDRLGWVRGLAVLIFDFLVRDLIRQVSWKVDFVEVDRFDVLDRVCRYFEKEVVLEVRLERVCVLLKGQVALVTLIGQAVVVIRALFSFDNLFQ